jgi:tRNA pseudouridine38-40 synthase
LLANRDRELAAPTFSPDGLYLAKVDYDARWGLPHEDDPAHTLPFELPFN